MRRLMPPIVACGTLLALAAVASAHELFRVNDSVDYESKWASLTFEVR
jgi:hypothetical protein